MMQRVCPQGHVRTTYRCLVCQRQRVEVRRQARRQAGGLDGRPWRRLRMLILERDGFTCQLRLPGCTGFATHVDHRVSRRDGGSDDPLNLQAACASCNWLKGGGGTGADAAQQGSGPPRAPRREGKCNATSPPSAVDATEPWRPGAPTS